MRICRWGARVTAMLTKVHHLCDIDRGKQGEEWGSTERADVHLKQECNPLAGNNAAALYTSPGGVFLNSIVNWKRYA